MNELEVHVLLALAGGARYGYAVKSAIEDESDGVLRPGAGSLYRVLARLMARGWVEETAAPADAEPHPGRARRYYRLTAAGERAVAAESRRLGRLAALAAERAALLDDEGSR